VSAADLPAVSFKTVQERLGGFNEYPVGWVEITESEFGWRSGGVGGFNCYRQVMYDGRPVSMHLFVGADFSGIGFIVEERPLAAREVVGDRYRLVFGKFAACAHEYATVGQGRCYWKGRCKKCGYEHVVDSSD